METIPPQLNESKKQLSHLHLQCQANYQTMGNPSLKRGRGDFSRPLQGPGQTVTLPIVPCDK